MEKEGKFKATSQMSQWGNIEPLATGRAIRHSHLNM